MNAQKPEALGAQQLHPPPWLPTTVDPSPPELSHMLRQMMSLEALGDHGMVSLAWADLLYKLDLCTAVMCALDIAKAKEQSESDVISLLARMYRLASPPLPVGMSKSLKDRLENLWSATLAYLDTLETLAVALQEEHHCPEGHPYP